MKNNAENEEKNQRKGSSLQSTRRNVSSTPSSLLANGVENVIVNKKKDLAVSLHRSASTLSLIQEISLSGCDATQKFKLSNTSQV